MNMRGYLAVYDSVLFGTCLRVHCLDGFRMLYSGLNVSSDGIARISRNCNAYIGLTRSECGQTGRSWDGTLQSPQHQVVSFRLRHIITQSDAADKSF